MIKLFLFIFLIPLSLYAEIDSDFDGVDDSVDRCLDTPFDKLVDKRGCPQNELYLGKINLELQYTSMLEDDDSSASFYLDYNYNNFLVSLSSAYESDYTHQNSLLLGYSVAFKNSLVKLYAGVEESDAILSGSYEYLWQEYVAVVSLNYYNQESGYISYMAGVAKNYDLLSVGVYYINSGSVEYFSDEYRSVESVVNYNIDERFYIKGGVNYSLVDEKVYDIYFAVGASFE